MSATLVEISEAVGSIVAIEAAAYVVCGAHVADAGPGAAVALSSQSMHHAWRAEELRRHLFAFGTKTVDDFLNVPPDVAAELQRAEHSPSALDAAAIVLNGVMRPLAERYRELGEQCSPVADGSLMRTLRILRADLDADAAEIERIVR